MSDQRLVEFHRGIAPDAQGRRLAEIQAWDDVRLETVHDYIQWLFPLPEASRFNDDVPLLGAADIAAFAASAALRASLRRSYHRLLAFYGFAAAGAGVVRAAGFALRARNWHAPGNHNYLRITRILRALTLLGLGSEARQFLAALEALYAEDPAAIGARALAYWRDAVTAAAPADPGSRHRRD